MAVALLNAQNDGKGIKVGYDGDIYLRFDYKVRRIAETLSVGDASQSLLTPEEYGRYHSGNASELALHSDFMIGTCSPKSSFEREEYTAAKKIVLAQVGPSAYYNRTTHPYVFGIHVSSYKYTYPFINSVHLLSASTPSVVIVGRGTSLFFERRALTAQNMPNLSG